MKRCRAGASRRAHTREKEHNISYFFSPTLPPDGLDWVYPDSQPTILAIDYSQYFVVIALIGYRGSICSFFKTLRIWQDSGTVYILAHFDDGATPGATSLPATSSQYQVIKISRTQITQPGTTTFRLLDETGQESATTTADDLAGNK